MSPQLRKAIGELKEIIETIDLALMKVENFQLYVTLKSSQAKHEDQRKASSALVERLKDCRSLLRRAREQLVS